MSKVPTYFPSENLWKDFSAQFAAQKGTSDCRKTYLKGLIKEYQPKKVLRAVSVCLVVSVIIVLLALMINNLVGVNALASVSTGAVIASTGVPLILLLGGGLVLAYIIKKRKDLFTKRPLGNIWDRSLTYVRMARVAKQTVTAKNDTNNPDQVGSEDCYFWDVDNTTTYMIDLEGLDESKTGIAAVYQSYPQSDMITHRASICTVGVIVMPFIALACIIYYLARAIVAPLYVLGRVIYQKNYPESLPQNCRAFELADMHRQCLLSISRAVKAPFYAAAFIMAFFFSLINPMNGRILVSAVERAWNNDVSRGAGIWVVSPTRYFKWEGGGLDPDRLGRNGYYALGCFQPFGLVYFKNGEQVSGCTAGAIEQQGSPNDLTNIRLFINSSDEERMLVLPE